MKKFLKKLLKGKAVGFTLAEVLLTLAIIGIVAALAIPPLVQKYNQRAWTSASSTFERKLGEALKIMYAKHTLLGHQTTRDFINELGKNLKIIKVCNQVTDCFTTSISQKNNDSTITSDLTTSTALGHSEFGTEAVGVQFASGVNAIIAYNKSYNYTESNEGKIVKFSTRSIGSNKVLKLLTNNISVVYDVNAFNKPNKIGADILGINSSISGDIGGCLTDTSLGSYCIKVLGTDYQPLNCQGKMNPEYCGPYSSGYDKDYWAGAKKACEDEGMTLPSAQDLKNIWAAGSHIDSFVPTSGHYFSSDFYPKTTNSTYINNAPTINFSNGEYGNSSNHGKGQQLNVLCID